MGSDLVTPHHLGRRAVVYVRQSTPRQVLENGESLRLQYALRQRARQLGWREADVEVVDASRLSPNMVRLTFAGPELEHMTSGGLDQRIKLVFPAEGQSEVVVPSGPRPLRAMRELPVHLRPRLRTYTVSAFRPRQEQLDVDFVLHGEGPGASFAMRAVPGDRLLIYAPNAEYPHGSRLSGVEYRMDALQGRTLLVGDETALPAIGAILRELPVGVHAKVFAEIPRRTTRCRCPAPPMSSCTGCREKALREPLWRRRCAQRTSAARTGTPGSLGKRTWSPAFAATWFPSAAGPGTR